MVKEATVSNLLRGRLPGYGLATVSGPGFTGTASAVGATIHGSPALGAVSDDPAAAVGTGRRHGVDGALEAVDGGGMGGCARGGLEGQRYRWGNRLLGGGDTHLCNIWQGTFPVANTRDDGHLGTAPVRSFPPNGYGLYEVSGNVWEWCSDWFLPKYYRNSPATSPQGPTIGGPGDAGRSYLCHESYCNRYRLAARSSNTAESSSGNTGFRTVALESPTTGGTAPN
jgi:hypothetical protein